MNKRFSLLFIGICMLILGCGPQPVTGGTAGKLLQGSEPVGDIQVTFFRQQDTQWVPVGFGVTNVEGRFELVQNAAQGPLHLPAGLYRFTLESVGNPLKIPTQYADAQKTPLQVEWQGGENELNLQIPVTL